MAEENFKSSDVLKFIYGGTCKKRFYILAIIRCEAEIYFSKVNNTIIIKTISNGLLFNKYTILFCLF